MVKQRVSIMINITLITTLLSSSLPAGSAQAAATFRDNAKGAMPAATGVSFKGLATSNAQTKTLSQQEQAELTEIFGVTPVRSVTVSLCGGTGTTYYDINGNKVGSFHKGAGYRYESLGTYYDKDGNIIRLEGTALSAEEQAELTKIFGVTPTRSIMCNVCTIMAFPEGSGSKTAYDIKYYDKNGCYIGRKHVGFNAEETYYDKDGKKIDTNSNTEIQPPVQPDKNEKDIRVWIKYIKDLISYMFKKFDLQKSSTLIKSWTNA